MNAIFVGEKRSGKTTLAFHIALNPALYDAGVGVSDGIIVFDPKKEFNGWPATVSNVEQLNRSIKQKHRVIIWRPLSDNDMQESFDALADWILQRHDAALATGWHGHFTLLIDEAYNLQSHAWINKKLLRILSQCRPEILNVFQTFQSVKNVNSDSRSRVSDWFLFTITLPTDLKRLEEFAMPEVIEQVRTLPEHEYVHFLNEKGTVKSEIVTNSAEWYEPLEYTPMKKGDGVFMSKEKDERDEWPEDGITVKAKTRSDWFEQRNKVDSQFERRTGKAEDSGERRRKVVSTESSEGGSKRKSKEIIFGRSA